ncbi:MAG: EMC3/TMCO1 family protein [Candidatus Bathyarchaeia archaeon]
MTFIDDIMAWFMTVLTPYSHVPQSTLFTIGVAIALGLTSSTAAKLLVDYDMVKNSMREFQNWRKELDKARKANDTQTMSKLMKKQQAMTKLQARASMEQFKVTGVTFVPFLIIWWILNAVFGHHIVAVAPWPLPIAGTQLNFVSWYFLSSFSVNFPLMRLFGIGMGEN